MALIFEGQLAIFCMHIEQKKHLCIEFRNTQQICMYVFTLTTEKICSYTVQIKIPMGLEVNGGYHGSLINVKEYIHFFRLFKLSYCFAQSIQLIEHRQT